jgi:hypothetical protein
VQKPEGHVVALPAGVESSLDLVRAVDDAIVRGDLRGARLLLAVLAGYPGAAGVALAMEEAVVVASRLAEARLVEAESNR